MFEGGGKLLIFLVNFLIVGKPGEKKRKTGMFYAPTVSGNFDLTCMRVQILDVQ